MLNNRLDTSQVSTSYKSYNVYPKFLEHLAIEAEIKSSIIKSAISFIVIAYKRTKSKFIGKEITAGIQQMLDPYWYIACYLYCKYQETRDTSKAGIESVNISFWVYTFLTPWHKFNFATFIPNT